MTRCVRMCKYVNMDTCASVSFVCNSHESMCIGTLPSGIVAIAQ
jgi:hypothetical protein